MAEPIKSFIEVQFPVSKISKESYKERKANYSQTLTGLGKWWGRKPLILVRAAILGLLLPASDNPRKDREIFLKILTMDEQGLWLRKTKNIPAKLIYSYLSQREKGRWFIPESTCDNPKLIKGLTVDDRKELQRMVFMRMSYDEKLQYCSRPEQVDGLPAKAWEKINSHLGTDANSLTQIVQQLGEKQFGKVPRVGDAFCGGGSIPFEAARMGCEAYGSDLNPVAALLTWAALNIIGGGKEVVEQVRRAQEEVYRAVDRQVTEWGIEHNELGWRADAYLYCNEVICPECGWKVPLAPSWVIGEKTRCVAKLQPDPVNKRFDILIEAGVTVEEMKEAKEAGTVKNSSLVCPNHECGKSTPITMIRGDRRTEGETSYGLRLWENEDLVPRPDDVFQERLYCIRWVEMYLDDEGRMQTQRHYCAPDENDLKREEKVLLLLEERFHDWQDNGYIPSEKIEPGQKTDEPIRTRGWTYWHHLFNPRQLLLNGLLMETVFKKNNTNREKLFVVAGILGIGRCADWNSRICRWDSSAANEKIAQTFYNQALNTLFSYASRGFINYISPWILNLSNNEVCNHGEVLPGDGRQSNNCCVFWITDPPYADAINYHELSDFFLAWYEKHIPKLFPEWYTDNKRALAITGSDENFRKSMVDCYRNLADHMPDHGAQIVMFTHQDAGVWADLTLILWASGLRVTAAWCVATETDSALKEGNYVQGTVLLVLRKQTSDEMAFLCDVYPEVENEVRAQLSAMLELDDREDPNFGDTDYQLAAYAAALRVLTRYRSIEDIDVTRELSRPKRGGEPSQIEQLIGEAVKIACDHLVPKDLDALTWKALGAEERFYLKGLDMESHGEYRTGAYQELARGFGIRDYRPFLANTRANQTRLKTAAEFSNRMLGEGVFDRSLVRQVLFAVREAALTEETESGRNWLRNQLGEEYWSRRKYISEILRYLSGMKDKGNMPHWQRDGEAAYLLYGAMENEHI